MRLLVGKPFATQRLKHERLGKAAGLAVFAADGLSSVAYATEEIILALMLAGTGAVDRALIPVSVAIVLLIFIVALSYRQTVMEYPSGGGAYIVARENLGPVVAQIAGAALLTDYVLTVAVSVSSGVAAITSAAPALLPYKAYIGVACVWFICMANLRGVRESAAVFAGPTYLFIGSMLTLVGVGLFRQFIQRLPPPLSGGGAAELTTALPLFLLLRAFASGCAALTGIEAIANGIQAFKEPSSKNAATVLAWLAALLAAMFIGTSYLAHHYHIYQSPDAAETVISQIARQSMGQGVFYYVIQAATAIILILAANTSFADFPRLASFQARDGYLPRQLSNLGDRLVFSNGIMVLAIVSSLLILLFGGDTHRLIPLYAVGVFTAFTLSQTGMVLHWLRLRNSSH
jgi:amino acid transporter